MVIMFELMINSNIQRDNVTPSDSYSLVSLYQQGNKESNHEIFGLLKNIEKLLTNYESDKAAMIAMHDAIMGKRHTAAFGFFCEGCDNSIKSSLSVESLFNLSRATCALDQDYWERLLNVVGARKFMPIKRRDAWHAGINQWRTATTREFDNKRPPAFNRETVLLTAKTLADERKDYFAEMVEGVFDNLSRIHYTNKNQGFSRKNIISNVIPTERTRFSNIEYLNDLRKIVGMIHGRDGAENVSSYNLVAYLQTQLGTFIEIDGGSLKVKGHKNGTVHVVLSEKICDDLNTILAYQRPNLIPRFKERGDKNNSNTHNPKEYPLKAKMLSFAACNILMDVVNSHRYSSPEKENGYYCFWVPFSYGRNDAAIAEVEELYVMAGGIEGTKSKYHFQKSPVDIFRYMAVHGTVPDQLTHQFYATRGDVRQRAIDESHFQTGHKLLEPSAGFGDLLKGIPEYIDVIAIEVHPVAAYSCGLSYETYNRDFLSVTVKELGLFDRVLMNPPYSCNRWKHHLKHAYQFLQSGGRLVAILPGSATIEKIRLLLGKQCDIAIAAVFDNQFEHTNISVKIITIDTH